MEFIAGIITGIMLSQLAFAVGRSVDISDIPTVLTSKKAKIIKTNEKEVLDLINDL